MMPRVIAVVCLLAAIAPGVAHAASSSFVAGSGRFDFAIGPGQVTFAAQVTQAGTRGHVSIDVTDTAFADLHADVYCADIDADRAVIGAALREPVSLQGYVYGHILIYVEDNADPTSEPDGAYAALATTAVGCALFEPFAVFPLTSGNVVIMDATDPMSPEG